MSKEDWKLGWTHASPKGENVRTNIINPLISRAAAVALAQCGSVATTRSAAWMWASIVVTLLAAGRPAVVNAQAQAAMPLYAPGVNYSLPSVVVTASRWAGFRDWRRSPMVDTVAFGVLGGSSVGRFKAASYTTVRTDESVVGRSM